jgi:HSP20 family molecular chaperone IbpA
MTTLTTYRPNLLGRGVFDDIFDSMLDFPQLMQRTTQGYPVADIYKNDDGSTTLEFALAGFDKNELSVEVKPEERTITVSAQSDTTAQTQRRIARRSFKKTYVNYDNNLDLTAAKADYENGLLTISLPTRPEAQAINVKID